MGLSYWRERAESKSDLRRETVAPFGSVVELRSTRRSARGFVKARYPGRWVMRRIRSPVLDWVYRFQWGALWLMSSPVALAIRLRPEWRTTWRVVGT